MADPELAIATGGYYSSAKLRKSSKKSQDTEGQEPVRPDPTGIALPTPEPAVTPGDLGHGSVDQRRFPQR